MNIIELMKLNIMVYSLTEQGLEFLQVSQNIFLQRPSLKRCIYYYYYYYY